MSPKSDFIRIAQERGFDISDLFGDLFGRRGRGRPQPRRGVDLETRVTLSFDDALQGVTDIVRGTDLLDSTPAHLHLQQALSLPSPVYWHLPVVVNAQGQKLSKQTGAAPVGSDASAVAIKALARLGLEVPEKARGEPPRVLWRWAEAVWQVQSLRGKRVLGTQH